MAWHLYIVPIALEPDGTRGAKYLIDLPVSWGMVDYGYQPTALAGADLTPAQNTALIANADVFAIPDNLDGNVGGNAAAFRQALEGVFVPAQWITGGQAYRSILRTVWGMFAYFQRYVAISSSTVPIIDGKVVTLSTQFQNLAAQVQTDLIATANNMALNISGLTPTNTLRNILKALSDDFGQHSFTAGGITV